MVLGCKAIFDNLINVTRKDCKTNHILSLGGRLSQGESLSPHEEDKEVEEKLVAEEGGHLEGPLQDQEEQQDAD